MMEFNACSINVESIKGGGSYFIYENDLYIETSSSQIVRKFKDHQINKKHVNSVSFTLSDTNKGIMHNGPFMIKSIDTKLTSGQTTIELLRSSWV